MLRLSRSPENPIPRVLTHGTKILPRLKNLVLNFKLGVKISEKLIEAPALTPNLPIIAIFKHYGLNDRRRLGKRNTRQ
ncbi:MAG: hypothetical protein EBR67_07705 [Proteobacteria bacterium]|jgi:hypothetical protein|nr:hypothetical protein [Pseudomonadota bacterium]